MNIIHTCSLSLHHHNPIKHLDTKQSICDWVIIVKYHLVQSGFFQEGGVTLLPPSKRSQCPFFIIVKEVPQCENVYQMHFHSHSIQQTWFTLIHDLTITLSIKQTSYKNVNKGLLAFITESCRMKVTIGPCNPSACTAAITACCASVLLCSKYLLCAGLPLPSTSVHNLPSKCTISSHFDSP